MAHTTIVTVTPSFPTGDGQPRTENNSTNGVFAVQIILTSQADPSGGIVPATCSVQVDRDYRPGGSGGASRLRQLRQPP